MNGLYVCPACRAVCEYEGEFDPEWSCPRCGEPCDRACCDKAKEMKG